MPSLATASGVPPDLAIVSAMAVISRTVSPLTLGPQRLQGAALAGRRWCAAEVIEDRIDGALADPGRTDFDAAHARLRAEGNEIGVHFAEFAAANAVFLLRQHDDGAALGRLVSERGELGGVGQFLLGDPAQAA